MTGWEWGWCGVEGGGGIPTYVIVCTVDCAAAVAVRRRANITALEIAGGVRDLTAAARPESTRVNTSQYESTRVNNGQLESATNR